jgi:hypothetical protein
MSDYKMPTVKKNAKNYVRIEISNEIMRQMEDPRQSIQAAIASLCFDAGIDSVTFSQTIEEFGGWTYGIRTHIQPLSIDLIGVQPVQ